MDAKTGGESNSGHMKNRWRIYQRERFPLLTHVPLVIVLSLSAMLFSSLQQEPVEPLDPLHIVTAALSTLILLFQARVADDYRHSGIDVARRRHRPVSRCPVPPRELARLAFLGGGIQFAIAMYIDVGLVPVLFTVWIYFGLTTKAFLAPERLRSCPAACLLGRALSMPAIAFYASMFDWLSECREIPDGLGWLLSTSFCCGIVLEIGRKIRNPGNRRVGVPTCSALRGTQKSVVIWTASVLATTIAYAGAASYISVPGIYLNMAGALLLLALMTAVILPREGGVAPARDRLRERPFEPSSGLAAMLVYLGLGPIQVAVG